MRLFLAIAAILAWLFGALLMLIPGEFYAPTGIKMTPMLATLAQAHGATLVGLGLIDWLARNADRRGIVAVLSGNLLSQLLSLGVVLRTMSLGAGLAVVPGIVIHVCLAIAFGFLLWRTMKDRGNNGRD